MSLRPSSAEGKWVRAGMCFGQASIGHSRRSKKRGQRRAVRSVYIHSSRFSIERANAQAELLLAAAAGGTACCSACAPRCRPHHAPAANAPADASSSAASHCRRDRRRSAATSAACCRRVTSPSRRRSASASATAAHAAASCTPGEGSRLFQLLMGPSLDQAALHLATPDAPRARPLLRAEPPAPAAPAPPPAAWHPAAGRAAALLPPLRGLQRQQ